MTQAGMEAEITGRPKHIYSIYRKMKRKKLRDELGADVSERAKLGRILSCMVQAPPKKVPRTLDNTREHEETMVAPEDDEVSTHELQEWLWGL